MPPQQAHRLLDLIYGSLDFGTHVMFRFAAAGGT
jgi:hypothetical protein